MPVCFLHVGSHKTGTSAIQVFLSKNRAALDRLGFLVPEAGTSSLGSHRTLVCDMLGMPVPPHQQRAFGRLKAEMAERPGHHVVVSAEMMETVFRHDLTRSPVVAFFKGEGYDVEIVLYVRNMPQWLNSRYTQVMKMFRRNEDFTDFVDKIVGRNQVNLGDWVDFVRNNGCGMRARAYTGLVQSGSIIEDFMRALGVDWPETAGQFVVAERVNETVGPAAIAVARRIMSAIPGGVDALHKKQSGKLGRILLQGAQEQPEREAKFSGLDSAGARRLEAHFRQSNDVFAKAFLGKTWDEVFAADVNEALTVNDLAQKTATPEESERVEALYRRVWVRAEPTLAGKDGREERKRNRKDGRPKAKRHGESGGGAGGRPKKRRPAEERLQAGPGGARE